MATIGINEAVENLKSMFPDMSSDSILIALKANSIILHIIENNLNMTIDFLLSHPEDKAKKFEESVIAPSESKNEDAKIDPDLLLAMELKNEEMTSQNRPKKKVIQAPEIPRPQEPVMEGKEYVFIHSKPAGTFVCMYPELLLKEDIKTIPNAVSAVKPPLKTEVKTEVKKDIEGLNPEEFEDFN